VPTGINCDYQACSHNADRQKIHTHDKQTEDCVFIKPKDEFLQFPHVQCSIGCDTKYDAEQHTEHSTNGDGNIQGSVFRIHISAISAISAISCGLDIITELSWRTIQK